MPSVSVRTVNGPQVARMLRNQSAVLQKESAMVLKMTARALAVDYGLQTDPPQAASEGDVAKFKARILKETRYVFPTREEGGKVFELIKQRDPALANAYYYAHKSGKVSQAAAIMRKAGLPQGGASVAALKNARTLKRAKVSSRSVPVSLLRSSESRAFARGQQKKVGIAKAGWHQAAKAIGGRARTAERLPAYVRATSRRYSDLGGAFVGSESIVIYSNVRHASDALRPGFKQKAEADSAERVQKAVAIMISKIIEKFNRTAA